MHIPPGFGALTPSIFADDAERLARFPGGVTGPSGPIRRISQWPAEEPYS